MFVGLLPELLAALGVVGRVDGVIEADDDNQDPSEGHEDPVRVQRVGIMRLTTGEGVVNRHGLTLEKSVGISRESEYCSLRDQSETE